MLSLADLDRVCEEDSAFLALKQLWNTLLSVKNLVLTALDQEMALQGELLKHHVESNCTMRLLCYKAGAIGNRCKVGWIVRQGVEL